MEAAVKKMKDDDLSGFVLTCRAQPMLMAAKMLAYSPIEQRFPDLMKVLRDWK